MDLKVLFGLLAGVALTFLCLICVVRWRTGRAGRKGRRGERIVARELQRLKRKDTIVLNDLILPTAGGRTSQIDHVVISTRGIFVIETKSLAGRISGSEHAQYWTQHLSSQSRQIYNPLLQNRSHLKVLRRLLPHLAEESFTCMTVFTEAWRLDLKADDLVEPRRILPDKHVRRTFIPSERRKRHWWCPWREVCLDERNVVMPLDDLTDEIKRRPKIIERDSLQEIREAIEAAVIKERGMVKEHVEYARETSRNIMREIRQGICPRCGGQLLIKRYERGEFVGCSNYPSCRFICSVDRLHS